MRRLWRSASWGILARSRLCGQGSIVHRREPRDGSTPSEDARLQHCGCHGKAHRAAACKIRRSVKCSRLRTRRNLPWTAWRLSKELGGSISGNCARDGRAREPPGRDGCTTLLAGQAFTRRHQRRSCTTPAVRRPAPLMAAAISASSESRGSGWRLLQAALFKPLWPWPWPHGSRSHPSRAATGNHRARARVPSAGP